MNNAPVKDTVETDVLLIGDSASCLVCSHYLSEDTLAIPTSESSSYEIPKDYDSHLLKTVRDSNLLGDQSYVEEAIKRLHQVEVPTRNGRFDTSQVGPLRTLDSTPISLLSSEGRVHGCAVADDNGEIVYVQADKTILAGGEYTGIFRQNKSVGIPYVLALEEGASLQNMEFVSRRNSYGGVATDSVGRTGVEGLYAVGSASSIRGLSELGEGDLAVLISQVSEISEISMSKGEANKETCNGPSFHSASGQSVTPTEVKWKARRCLKSTLTGRRSISDHRYCLDKCQQLRALARIARRENLEASIRVGCLLRIGEVVAISSMSRRESRGCHSREGYTSSRRKFDRNSVVQMDSLGGIRHHFCSGNRASEEILQDAFD